MLGNSDAGQRSQLIEQYQKNRSGAALRRDGLYRLPDLARHGYPLHRKSLPFANWYDQCSTVRSNKRSAAYFPDKNSSRSRTTAYRCTINPFNQGCGNAHFPPNGRSNYDQTNTFTVPLDLGALLPVCPERNEYGKRHPNQLLMRARSTSGRATYRCQRRGRLFGTCTGSRVGRA